MVGKCFVSSRIFTMWDSHSAPYVKRDNTNNMVRGRKAAIGAARLTGMVWRISRTPINLISPPA